VSAAVHMRSKSVGENKVLDIQLSLSVRVNVLQSALPWGTGWGTRVGKLTARKAATAPPGIYADDGGLYLCVSQALTRLGCIGSLGAVPALRWA
jgi:hypothetical protein